LNENIEQLCMQLELNSNLIEKEWEANWCKNCKFYLRIMVEPKKTLRKHKFKMPLLIPFLFTHQVTEFNINLKLMSKE